MPYHHFGKVTKLVGSQNNFGARICTEIKIRIAMTILGNSFLSGFAIKYAALPRMRIIKTKPFFHKLTNCWCLSKDSRVVSESAMRCSFPPRPRFSMSNPFVVQVR